MNRGLAVFLVLGLLVPVSTRGAIKVEVARPAGVDYSGYGSFGFRAKEKIPDGHPLSSGSPLLEEARTAARSELLRRGLTHIEGDTPDLWITFDGLGREELSIEGARRDLGPVTWVGDPGAHSSRTVIHATLLVEVFDASTGERVWTGWATDQSTRREKLRARIDKAVQKILEAFPAP